MKILEIGNQSILNHVVLAINGQSSNLPYPAGSYKNEQQTEKTLEVSFGTRFPNQAPELIGKITPQRSNFSILPGFYNVNIENPTGAAWYNISFDLSSENSQVRVFGATDIPALLPYQSVTISIFVYNMNNAWPEKDQLAINIKVNEQEVFVDHVEIENAPQFVQYVAHPYTLIGLVAGSILLALGAGSLLVFRRKR